MIRIAAIGTSKISGLFIDAVRQVEGVEVTTIVSRDGDRARRFADENGVAEATAHLDALLISGAIDAVYVGSPNGVHAEQTRTAIDAGVHVFVEKPAVPTAAEFAALAERARSRDVVLFEGMRNAYDPAFDVIRELLPQIGVVRRVAFAKCQRSARYDTVLAGGMVNIFDPALAGGALRDLGVYPISAIVSMFGSPRTVAAMSVPIATGADGSGSALLGYDGFVGEIAYSKITASGRPNEIQGEKGTLLIDDIAHPAHVSVTLLDGTVTAREIIGAENNMVHEVARFATLVAGDRDARSDNDRTLAVLRVVDSIIAADRTGTSR